MLGNRSQPLDQTRWTDEIKTSWVKNGQFEFEIELEFKIEP